MYTNKGKKITSINSTNNNILKYSKGKKSIEEMKKLY
jgi:hypothetical protein